MGKLIKVDNRVFWIRGIQNGHGGIEGIDMVSRVGLPIVWGDLPRQFIARREGCLHNMRHEWMSSLSWYLQDLKDNVVGNLDSRKVPTYRPGGVDCMLVFIGKMGRGKQLTIWLSRAMYWLAYYLWPLHTMVLADASKLLLMQLGLFRPRNLAFFCLSAILVESQSSPEEMPSLLPLSDLSLIGFEALVR
ncbi:uncharacterized protein G2W53_007406 [Senna tora]|uniref:Uncharacterized protein n=1 Tax=Senna tora TaxID=362788 RepID=A0A834X724_9FABA|nr:uncharacterized protein G2W53_007406 [Senna tora]